MALSAEFVGGALVGGALVGGGLYLLLTDGEEAGPTHVGPTGASLTFTTSF